MSDYQLIEITPYDTFANRQMDNLLKSQGIRRDPNLDYSCALIDDNGNMVATGSSFASTLRCMAVDSNHQGEGLLNEIASHLIERQYSLGNTHLFLYTKGSSVKFFNSLGFYEITRVNDDVVFMENRRNGFSSYIDSLISEPVTESGAVVINGNPFTCGHRYLIEQAARCCKLVHLFVIREDVSEIPFAIRFQMAQEGTRDLSNVILHDTDNYLISNATFPSYFLNQENDAVEMQARLEVKLFALIADKLNITRRFFGSEPFNRTTDIYNQTLKEVLPALGVDCVIIDRKESDGIAISASEVRQAIAEKNKERIRQLVPDSTFRILNNDEYI